MIRRNVEKVTQPCKLQQRQYAYTYLTSVRIFEFNVEISKLIEKIISFNFNGFGIDRNKIYSWIRCSKYLTNVKTLG